MPCTITLVPARAMVAAAAAGTLRSSASSSPPITTMTLRTAHHRLAAVMIASTSAAAYSTRLPGSARPSRLPTRKPRSAKSNSPSSSSAMSPPDLPESHAQGIVQRRADADLSSDTSLRSLTSSSGTARPTLDHATVLVPYDQGSDAGVIDRDASLRESVASILGQPSMVVTREIEMMNVFLGFEQANRYSLVTPDGYQIGYMAERETGALGGTLRRQLLRTHRAFEAQVMDTHGRTVLTIKRPTTLINSRVQVWVTDARGGESLVGEVHQKWHPYKRKYELFVNQAILDGDGGGRMQDSMTQFAAIDGGLLAWDFVMTDENDRPLGAISRNFRGLGRELFTDTGQYVLTFDPTSSPELRLEEPQSSRNQGKLSTTSTGLELVRSGPSRALTMDERAVALATAVSADFDYFSRHSQGGHGSMFPFIWMGGGGSQAEQPPAGGEPGAAQPPGTQQGQDSSDVRAPPPAPGSDGGLGPAVGTGVGYDMLGGGRSNGSDAQQPQQQEEQPWWGDTGSPSSRGEGDMGAGQEDTWGGGHDPWQGADNDNVGVGGDGGSGWSWTDFLPGGGGDE